MMASVLEDCERDHPEIVWDFEKSGSVVGRNPYNISNIIRNKKSWDFDFTYNFCGENIVIKETVFEPVDTIRISFNDRVEKAKDICLGLSQKKKS